MFTSLEGRSVMVTGASKGIGKGIATAFANAGCRVLLLARHIEDAELTAESIRQQGGVAAAFSSDVTNQASIQAAVEEVVRLYGGLDILCANAGIFPSATLDDMTEADWDLVIDTNLKGTFFTVQSCLRELRKSTAGRIILTSSITGPITGFPGWCHYAASKAGQLGFLRTAALELAKDNITVNAVMPGNIITEGLEGMGDDYLAQMAASIPLKRLGRVEDIANAMLYFASAESGYVTGQTLVVDGGQILPESLEAL